MKKKSSTPEGSQLVLPTSQFSTWINIQDRAQGAQGNILDLSRQYQVLTDSSCDEHDVSKETNGLFLRSHSESHISDFEPVLNLGTTPTRRIGVRKPDKRPSIVYPILQFLDWPKLLLCIIVRWLTISGGQWFFLEDHWVAPSLSPNNGAECGALESKSTPYYYIVAATLTILSRSDM